jgi:signal transduction histidine kinase
MDARKALHLADDKTKDVTEQKQIAAERRVSNLSLELPTPQAVQFCSLS